MSYEFNVDDLSDNVKDIWTDTLGDYMDNNNIGIEDLTDNEYALIEVNAVKCYLKRYSTIMNVNDLDSIHILLNGIILGLDN